MMRVISSPSSSTTGLATLIFGMLKDSRIGGKFAPPGGDGRPIANGFPMRKPERGFCPT
jgi:hypothetical protein